MIYNLLNSLNVYFKKLFNTFPELNEKGAWERLQVYKRFHEFTQFEDNCERINETDFSPDEFINKYERLYKPVVICGIQDHWKAKFKWTLEVSIEY